MCCSLVMLSLFYKCFLFILMYCNQCLLLCFQLYKLCLSVISNLSKLSPAYSDHFYIFHASLLNIKKLYRSIVGKIYNSICTTPSVGFCSVMFSLVSHLEVGLLSCISVLTFFKCYIIFQSGCTFCDSRDNA